MVKKLKTFEIEEDIWNEIPHSINKSAAIRDFIAKMAKGEPVEVISSPSQNEIKLKREFNFLKVFSKKLNALMNEMKNSKYATEEEFKVFMELMNRNGISQTDYQKFTVLING